MIHRAVTWWTGRLRALQFSRASYVRLYPNPGFSLCLTSGVATGRGARWLHYCRACGWCILGPGQVRRARKPKEAA